MVWPSGYSLGRTRLGNVGARPPRRGSEWMDSWSPQQMDKLSLSEDVTEPLSPPAPCSGGCGHRRMGAGVEPTAGAQGPAVPSPGQVWLPPSQVQQRYQWSPTGAQALGEPGPFQSPEQMFIQNPDLLSFCSSVESLTAFPGMSHSNASGKGTRLTDKEGRQWHETWHSLVLPCIHHPQAVHSTTVELGGKTL